MASGDISSQTKGTQAIYRALCAFNQPSSALHSLAAYCSPLHDMSISMPDFSFLSLYLCTLVLHPLSFSVLVVLAKHRPYLPSHLLLKYFNPFPNLYLSCQNAVVGLRVSCCSVRDQYHFLPPLQLPHFLGGLVKTLNLVTRKQIPTIIFDLFGAFVSSP